MARTPALVPDPQFPGDALQQSVQVPGRNDVPSMVFTWQIASAADSITPWGRNVSGRDRQLRDFWPTESFLAGALANVSFRNAAYEWEIRGNSTTVETLLTEMLEAAIAGDSFGWSSFIMKFSEDLYSQDNGGFIELIRDPGQDAGSRFREEKAPVLGIAHLDSNQCQRTGNPEFPVIYTDRNGKTHKLPWYQVIPFSDYPSAIERMNGVGYCAITRALRLSQIMRSICIFKDEKISGRQYKALHMVSGVSRQDIKDILTRGKEDADNSGLIRYIEPAILASLDPEKSVSVATIDLANLPDGFNFDEEMKWYISGLALSFGVDYQDFAPLPGGAIGSSSQSIMLNRKSAGKGPAMFMKIAKAFKNYGVLPRGYDMIFEDRDEQRELDKATLRKTFQEEMALALRNGYLTPDAARKIGIQRGFYTETELAGIPEDYGKDLLLPKQNFGDTGGNTISEDASRTRSGPPEPNSGAGLRKETADTTVMQDVRSLLEKMFTRKEKTDVNVTVHNHPGKPPEVVIKEDQAQVAEAVRSLVRATEAQKLQVENKVENKITVPPSSVVVKTPRVKKEKQRVIRDSQKNMTGTETTVEYEE